MTDDNTSQKSAVQKSDFRILRTIGRGTYGKVYLVQHNLTEQIFAMKSVLKDLLIKTDQLAGIRGNTAIPFPSLCHADKTLIEIGDRKLV